VILDRIVYSSSGEVGRGDAVRHGEGVGVLWIMGTRSARLKGREGLE